MTGWEPQEDICGASDMTVKIPWAVHNDRDIFFYMYIMAKKKRKKEKKNWSKETNKKKSQGPIIRSLIPNSLKKKKNPRYSLNPS